LIAAAWVSAAALQFSRPRKSGMDVVEAALPVILMKSTVKMSVYIEKISFENNKHETLVWGAIGCFYNTLFINFVNYFG
jgi:hypothetical protein